MKKIIAVVLTLALLSALMAGCGAAKEKAPESMAFTVSAHLLSGEGETFDAAAVLELTGEGVSREVVYSTSDEAVATVSAEGVVTAVGAGSATITAVSALDETVMATMDVAVYDYSGVYAGEKFIEAMGCNIAVEITLNSDGTFAFYRAPMVIEMAGGGEMPEMTDQGTYVVEGAEIQFTAEELGEFTVSFTMDGDAASIEGKIPTGGPSTDMVLNRGA